MTLLDKKEVAALLKVGVRTVTRLFAQGRLRAVRVGRRVRFRLRDVEAYVGAQLTEQGGGGAEGKPASSETDLLASFDNCPQESPLSLFPTAVWTCDRERCRVEEVKFLFRRLCEEPPSLPPPMRCRGCGYQMRFRGYVSEQRLRPD